MGKKAVRHSIPPTFSAKNPPNQSSPTDPSVSVRVQRWEIKCASPVVRAFVDLNLYSVLISRYKGEAGHIQRMCPQNASSGGGGGGYGHDQGGFNPPMPGFQNSTRTCFNCGQTGHISRDCTLGGSLLDMCVPMRITVISSFLSSYAEPCIAPSAIRKSMIAFVRLGRTF
jgi:hypothetical protein